MKAARYSEIASLVERFDKLPDDAFVAALEAEGVTASDLKSFTREKGKRERDLKLARRR